MSKSKKILFKAIAFLMAMCMSLNLSGFATEGVSENETETQVKITKTIDKDGTEVYAHNLPENQRYSGIWGMSVNNQVTFEFDITEPGVYLISGTLSSAGTNPKLSVDGNEVIQFSVNTGSFSDWAEISITEYEFSAIGKYYIKLACSGETTSLGIKNMTVTRLRDADNVKITKKIDKEGTEVYETNVVNNESQRYGSMWGMATYNYVTFAFEITQPGVYLISSNLSSAGTNPKLSVDGNEAIQFSVNTGGFNVWTEETSITEYAFPTVGTYYIKLACSGEETSLLIKDMTVTRVRDLDNETETQVKITKKIDKEGTEVYETNVPDNGTQRYGSMWGMAASDYVTFEFDIPQPGVYLISSNLSSAGTEPKLWVDDKEVKQFLVNTGGFNIWTEETSITERAFPIAGKYYIKLTCTSTTSFLIRDMTVTRLRDVDEGAYVTNLNIVSEDDACIPGVIEPGLKCRAAASVYKISDKTENLLMVIGEFEETETGDLRLRGAEALPIDTTDMTVGETRIFECEYPYKGTGGYVKAFVFDNESISPLAESVCYEDNKIFSDAILEEDTKWVYATEVNDPDGKLYSDEYNLHNDKYDIDAIFYDSPVGEQTKVFAYVGIPKGASAENPVPGIVLCHGALLAPDFKEWIKLWNDRGFAAIAMDMYGGGPQSDSSTTNGKRQHGFGGVAPFGVDATAFSLDLESACWYQTIQNAIRAHNVLRSFEGVDKSKIGITGVSYGGVTTTMAVGADNRFAFAAPVYGAGYLVLGSSQTYNKPARIAEGKSILWDPANFAARAKCPILFINNDADTSFGVKGTSLTYGVAQDGYLSLRRDLFHSHGDAWKITQIYDFAEKVVNGNTQPYIKVSGEKIENGYLTADLNIPAGTEITAVRLLYTQSEAVNSAAVWEEYTTEYTLENGVLKIAVPDSYTACYAYIKTSDHTGEFKPTTSDIAITTKVMFN